MCISLWPSCNGYFQCDNAPCWTVSNILWDLENIDWRKGLPVAWMPDELSPAHNIVCWGCSVWPRSVEEKLWPITNQSDQSNCQDGLYTMMNRWSDQSNCQGGLHTMLDRSPVRGSRAAGLPGRGAPGPGLRNPARGTHGARTWLRGGALPARGGFHSHLETFCTF